MAANVTREEIAQYLSYEKDRLAAQRQVDNLARAAKPLKEKIEAYAQTHGGKDRTCRHAGYVLQFLLRKVPPSWKDEFLRVAGEAEAAKVQSEERTKEYLVVTPEAS